MQDKNEKSDTVLAHWGIPGSQRAVLCCYSVLLVVMGCATLINWEEKVDEATYISLVSILD